MDFASFLASLSAAEPPRSAGPLLRALWLEKTGHFAAAHAIAQDVDGADGALVHAYLHRREGDLANAGYWYRRAHVAPAEQSLDAEWAALVQRFL
jgi:hypothetical protein